MKTFKHFLLEVAGAPKQRVVAATGVNGSGQTTVTYSDGTSETLTGSRAIRNNNPGNLEYGTFAKNQGAVGSDGRYAVFPTPEIGYTAKINLLKTNTYQNLSIRDAFNRYAPPSENPNYLRDLQDRTGFDLNRKMSSLNDQEFKKLVDAVAVIEGAASYVGKYSPSSAQSIPRDHVESGQQSSERSPEEKAEAGEGDFSSWEEIAKALKKVTDVFTSYGR